MLSALEMAAAIPASQVTHFSEGSIVPSTINAMHRAVLQAKADADWRTLMEDIRRQGRDSNSIGWKDYLGEAEYFNSYFRNIRPLDYVRDPHQVELVKHPFLTLESRSGDCDDLSTAWCAALGAIGAPHRFRTYMADPTRPKEWTHVVGQVFIPGHGWVNNDLTIRGAALGFEPNGFVTKDWPEPRY